MADSKDCVARQRRGGDKAHGFQRLVYLRDGIDVNQYFSNYTGLSNNLLQPAEKKRRIDHKDSEQQESKSRQPEQVKGASGPRMQSGPLIEGASASHVQSGPLMEGASASHVQSGPLMEGASGSRMQSGPLMEGASGSRMQSGPLMEGANGSNMQSGPLMEGASGSCMQSGPLMEGANGSNMQSGPLMECASGPLMESASGSHMQSGPLMEGAYVPQVESGPTIEGGSQMEGIEQTIKAFTEGLDNALNDLGEHILADIESSEQGFIDQIDLMTEQAIALEKHMINQKKYFKGRLGELAKILG